MAIVYSALYNGTAATLLTAYTPEVGPSPANPFGGVFELDGSGNVRYQSGSTFARYDLTSASYTTQSITFVADMPATVGELHHWFRGTTQWGQGYAVSLVNTGSGVQVEIWKNFVSQVSNAAGLVAGTTYTVLVTIDNSHTINVYLNGSSSVFLTYTDVSGSPFTSGILGIAKNAGSDPLYRSVVLTDTVDTPVPPTDYPEPYTKLLLRNRYAQQPVKSRWYGTTQPAAKIINQEFFPDPLYIGADGERVRRLGSQQSYTIYLGNRTLF